MNIEEKKKILRSYSYYQEELERLYYQLNEIRIKCYGKVGVQAITYSDMPKGGTSPDMADEIANMVDLERGIIKRILKIHSKINKTDKAIEDLNDIDMIRIIKLRYYNRYSFKNISKKIHLGKTTVQDKHKIALELLKL
ncbi:hypothetical protein [Miniphocaeibacter massiliensis]|uniref:hypothetical protein n=1 Tax=Miniphocaeibacter massiliensis TaxID=2041841 RepID=UPI000C1BEECC|nr:hypothetical protein [Miniphocaeibacter massiliensis]